MKKLSALVIFIIAAGLYFSDFITASNAREKKNITLSTGQNVSWPPQLSQPYPDLELIDHRGNKVKLSDFKGKVIIIEPVGMTCSACNAFSGGGEKGGYKDMGVQKGLLSMEKYFPKYTNGISLHDDRIVYIQLLLYSLSMGAPTADDAKLWAEHFGLDKYSNAYILSGDKNLLGKASYNMIPGFQLVDKNFILRVDSTGHSPQHDLFGQLLPSVPVLLKE